jgi:hypothetical protein
MSKLEGKYNTYTLNRLHTAVLLGDIGTVRALSKSISLGLGSGMNFEDRVGKTGKSVNFMTRAKNTIGTRRITQRNNIKNENEYKMYLYDYILKDKTARGIAERIMDICKGDVPSMRDSILPKVLMEITNSTDINELQRKMKYIKVYLLSMGAAAKTGFGILARRKNAQAIAEEKEKEMAAEFPVGGSGRKGRNTRRSRKDRNARKTRKTRN